MGWLVVILGGLATYGFYEQGQVRLAVLAGILTAINLWSYGVMHNFAVNAATHRADYRGGFSDFTKDEAKSAPNWATNVNMATAFMLLGLLIWVLVIWLA